jgi:hypothetical protein
MGRSKGKIIKAENSGTIGDGELKGIGLDVGNSIGTSIGEIRGELSLLFPSMTIV